MRKLVIALALTAGSVVTARAAPINVVPSSPLTFNGFTFDNFSCLIQTNTGNAGPIDCGQITVSQASSNAITIGGAFFANTPPSISTEDVKIGYRVTSTMPITGVSLDFNASTLDNAFANVTNPSAPHRPRPTLARWSCVPRSVRPRLRQRSRRLKRRSG